MDYVNAPGLPSEAEERWPWHALRCYTRVGMAACCAAVIMYSMMSPTSAISPAPGGHMHIRVWVVFKHPSESLFLTCGVSQGIT